MEYKKLANNFDDFIKKVENSIKEGLNNTEIGRNLTNELLKLKLADNPNMTPAEWSDTKSEFLTFLFVQMMKENEDLMHELAGHVYDEINKEN